MMDKCSRVILCWCAAALALIAEAGAVQHNNFIDIHGEDCAVDCAGQSLERYAWPPLPRAVACASLYLISCPANNSYIYLMNTANVTVTKKLELMYLPKDSKVTMRSLHTMPRILAITADKGDDVLDLQPGALENSGVHELRLTRVRPHELPSTAFKLSLIHTHLEVLPEKALEARELEIEEDQLVAITGPAPNMIKMSLTSPSLKVLMLYDGYQQVLRAGFAQSLPRLHSLALERMNRGIGGLPDGFLVGASNLQMFKAVYCDLQSLPRDLFNYSHQLELIDLTGNYIETLPPGLLLLRSLRTLLLAHNRLTAHSIAGLGVMSWLTELSLTRNPLGNLCRPGQTSPLWPMRNLASLKLAETSLTHICSDWLRTMRSLVELDLRDNYLGGYSCADLHVWRAPTVSARVDVTHNNITRAICNKNDYSASSMITSLVSQRVEFVFDLPFRCDCNYFWFTAVVQSLKVSIVAPSLAESCAKSNIDPLKCTP